MTRQSDIISSKINTCERRAASHILSVEIFFVVYGIIFEQEIYFFQCKVGFFYHASPRLRVVFEDDEFLEYRENDDHQEGKSYNGDHDL